MSFLSHSSGNLIADRRYAFGQDYAQRGDHAAAADLFAQTVEVAPGFAAAWFALGEARDRIGETEAAIEAFRKVQELDPQDRHGAGLHLMRLKADAVTDMPRDYVRTLFDQYAPRFDEALTQKLAYRGPELVFDAVSRACAGTCRRLADLSGPGARYKVMPSSLRVTSNASSPNERRSFCARAVRSASLRAVPATCRNSMRFGVSRVAPR